LGPLEKRPLEPAIAMSPDCLRLQNLRFYGYHGLFPEEGRLGQQFEVDVELYRDLAAAGASDNPADTIDYTAVLDLVEKVVTGDRCQLVEAVAERIAHAIGTEFGPLELVVRVRKPNPPVATQFDGVEVEIRRSYA